jgi:hypothetical protein
LEAGGVLLRKAFGGKLGGAVERDGRFCAEVSLTPAALTDSARADAVENKAEDSSTQGQLHQRGNGVDAAGAEQDETGVGSAAVFQQIDGAEQIVFKQLACAGFAVAAGQNAGLGGGVDDPIDAGRVSRSLAMRMSPWNNCTPSFLSDEPVGFTAKPARLSSPTMVMSFARLDQIACDVVPTKPQTPEMRIFILFFDSQPRLPRSSQSRPRSASGSW